MIITINTDASFYPDTKDAGYAFWISSNVGRFKKYGKLKSAKNNTEAELQAIGNAVHFVLHHPELKHFSMLIINTDAEYCINAISEPTKYFFRKSKRTVRFRKIRDKIVKQLKGKNVSLRHVRGHQKDLSKSRAWVNDYLDRMAKKGAKL